MGLMGSLSCRLKRVCELAAHGSLIVVADIRRRCYGCNGTMSMSETDPVHDDAVFACPHCGEEVDVIPGDPAPFMVCPHCRNEFVVTPSPTPGEDEEARLR